MAKKTKRRKPEIRWMIEDDKTGHLLNWIFPGEKGAKEHIGYYRWKGVTPVEVEITKVK